MSFSGDISSIIAQILTGQAHLYSQVAVAVLVVYEYATTLSMEVQLYWEFKHPTSAMALFLANRYLSLGYFVFLGVVTFCNPQTEQYTFVLALYIVWACFSGLRVLAVSRSRVKAALTCLVAAIPVVVNAYDISFLAGAFVPGVGWESTLNESETAIQRGALIAADSAVVCATWYTLWHSRKNAAALNTNVPTLSHILLRDGTVYFISLALLNALHLIFTLIPLTQTGGTSLIVVFSDPLTAILVSRFLLNLQAANRGLSGIGSTVQGSQLGSVVFERVVECMGGLVEFAGEEELDDDNQQAESPEAEAEAEA
ncbi:uncharacterized protein BXZ73DRAFT_102231 [Epithele typhae]|uniref:uncharacterized protein n=1 Tax=Epithele typhae TaxID=378194 RepID=UPI0020082FC2|nr:uncharacterized protein BXZ73DRAFT_102231 [Epithele typhae]KAH9929077.1 hypothetical protein BXZ73DRAFT_102231 [Epithele typhae]